MGYKFHVPTEFAGQMGNFEKEEIMKQKIKGKNLLCSVLVCFFVSMISANAFAVDELDPGMIKHEESFGVVKIMELFQNILDSREDNLTISGIETMVGEINSLHEEIYATLFNSDGERIIESDEDCASIRGLASLYLLRSASLGMSLVGDIVKAYSNPPQDAMQLMRLGIRLVRKVSDLVTVSYNTMLIYTQYRSCQRSSDVN
jgi:hypothetical protein